MKELIEAIVSAIQDKKGKRIASLDLTGFDGAICSYFVICNADSTTQVGAIAAGIEEKVLEKPAKRSAASKVSTIRYGWPWTMSM